MICNQCGKNNPFGVKECTYCGTPMPAKSGCGGFEDILTYKPPVAPAPAASTPSTGMGGTGGYGTNPTLRGPAVPPKPAPKNHFALYGMIVALVLIVALWISVNNLSAAVEKLTATQQSNQQAIELLTKRLEIVESDLASIKTANQDSGMTNLQGDFNAFQESFGLAYGKINEEAEKIVSPANLTVPSNNDDTEGEQYKPSEKITTGNQDIPDLGPAYSSWIF